MKERIEQEGEMTKLRLSVIRLLAYMMFLCFGAAALVLLNLFIPSIAFYGVLVALAVAATFWAIDALNERQVNRIAKIHKATIEGFVYAQAADDRGEMLRNAVRLAATNGQIERSALSMNARIQEEAKKLASQANSMPKQGSDEWDFMDDFSFAETE